MNDDPLYQIFDKHIHSSQIKFDHEQELIHHVVTEYIYLLMQQGGIVESALNEIEQDLREEVIEMISKKICDYPNLQQYRRGTYKKTEKTG